MPEEDWELCAEEDSNNLNRAKSNCGGLDPRYGNVGEDAYFLRLVFSGDGKMVCSNAAFNSDPAKGQPKACWRGPEFMGPSTTTTTRTGEKSEAIINGEICS